MSELEYTCNNCGHEGYNTPAVPDVPELVVVGALAHCYYYRVEQRNVWPVGAFELVRKDQAAAIIAAKEDQISLAETTMIQMHRELSALEAKLAAKDEEFVSKLKEKNLQVRTILEEISIDRWNWKERAEAAEAKIAQIKAQEPVTHYIVSEFWAGFDKVKMLPIGRHPLYAAPVDQNAEIDRLKEVLRKAHASVENDRTGKFKEIQDEINKALSEKDSQ